MHVYMSITEKDLLRAVEIQLQLCTCGYKRGVAEPKEMQQKGGRE
jgi:hypothetical protein